MSQKRTVSFLVYLDCILIAIVPAPLFPSASGLFAVNAHIDDDLFAMDFFHNLLTADDSLRRYGESVCREIHTEQNGTAKNYG